jgi:hypothetical protein
MKTSTWTPRDHRKAIQLARDIEELIDLEDLRSGHLGSVQSASQVDLDTMQSVRADMEEIFNRLPGNIKWIVKKNV